jgi:hypothetical protein
MNVYRRYVPIAGSLGPNCFCRLAYHDEYKRVWGLVFPYLAKNLDASESAGLYKYITHVAPPLGTVPLTVPCVIVLA